MWQQEEDPCNGWSWIHRLDTVKLLNSLGYLPVVLDNLSNGHRELVKWGEFVHGDITDDDLMKSLFCEHSFEAVMHFAAYAYVDESVSNPAKYYHNNVAGTLQLLKHMVIAGVNKIVFSSTCATYGDSSAEFIDETHPQRPINPYGASKLMAERIIDDFSHAHGIAYAVFRYFNAAGADPEGEVGEWHEPEMHLIPLILDAAAGSREAVYIHGTDYATPDGTCVRDFIHVNDIAQAHLLGLKHVASGKPSDCFNLSNRDGYSVREVIRAVEKVTGKKIGKVETHRRPGDPARLVGTSHKAAKILGWKPHYPSLEAIVESAWKWHQSLSRKLIAT